MAESVHFLTFPIMPDLAGSPTLDSLADACGRLPEPTDYYQGAGSGEAIPLKNVLCFARREREGLLQGAVRHLHHRCVLILNLQGSGIIGVEDSLHRFEPGDAFLILPHQVHLFPSSPGQGLAWFFITFEGGPDKKLQLLNAAPARINERARLYAQLLAEAYTSILELKTAEEEEAIALLRLLLRELGRSINAARRSRRRPQDRFIDRVTSHVYRSLEEAPGLKETAAELGMSESHLRKTFRDKSGQSVGQFIKRTRLARATALLAQSTTPIGEVAERCGFSSIYSFSRAFSSAIGMSPRAYRRQNAAG